MEARQAELFLADGLVVTGKFTGEETSKEDLHAVKEATALPVLIGSGMTVDNIASLLPLADSFIVGSTFRKNGAFLERLAPQRLAAFMEVFSRVRSNR